MNQYSQEYTKELIMAGEITRPQALEQLKGIPFSSASQMQADEDFFLKKFNWSKLQFDEYLARPEVKLGSYGSDIDLLKYVRPIRNFHRSIKRK